MLARRAIKTREQKWVHRFAKFLITLGFTPNDVSLLSIFFSAGAGVCLLATASEFSPVRFFLAAAFFIQLRLLCNMMDGVLAVEGKLSTKLGDLFNEIPDRISDSLILVCAGYAVSGHPYGVALGWSAALLAVATAYLRLLGTSLGTKAYFSGPMAKPHRMFTLTVACILGANFIFPALVLIVSGSVVTCFRRINFIVKEMIA